MKFLNYLIEARKYRSRSKAEWKGMNHNVAQGLSSFERKCSKCDKTGTLLHPTPEGERCYDCWREYAARAYKRESENVIKHNPVKDTWTEVPKTSEYPNGWKVRTDFNCIKCQHTERVTPEFKKKYYTPKGNLIITCPKCNQKHFVPH